MEHVPQADEETSVPLPGFGDGLYRSRNKRAVTARILAIDGVAHGRNFALSHCRVWPLTP